METALEWFFNEIDKTFWDYMTVEQQQHIFQQAKEMEKKQMADAFYAPTNLAEPKNFNEYYKQKYEDED